MSLLLKNIFQQISNKLMTIRVSYLILLIILLLDLIPLIIGINMTLCKILLLLLFRHSFVSIFESFITATQERSMSTLYSYYSLKLIITWRVISVPEARYWFIVLTPRIRNWCLQRLLDFSFLMLVYS